MQAPAEDPQPQNENNAGEAKVEEAKVAEVVDQSEKTAADSENMLSNNASSSENSA